MAKMKVHNRDQFTNEMLKKLDAGTINDALWIPESISQPTVKCIHFVRVKPVMADNDDYWPWCKETLQGELRCFTSDGVDQEWWGFTNYDDIIIWTLKWVGNVQS